jgi:multiple sugar transport system permease protein
MQVNDTLLFRSLRAIVLTAACLFVVAPLFVAATTSLTPLTEMSTSFSWLPEHITLGAFAQIWSYIPFSTYFINSLVVTAFTVGIAVPVGVAASYAVSRYRFRGRQTFLTAILSTQLFPGIFFFIPLYLIFIKLQSIVGLQIVGSRIGLIIVYVSFVLPLCIWVLSGYFAAIPRDIEQAGMIDGLSEVRSFVRLVLPSNIGAIMAVATFAVVMSWSEVLFASVMTTSRTETLPVALSDVVAQPTTIIHWNLIMAASIYASAPIVVAFSFVQRRFVQGLSVGAVKG